MQFKRVFVVVSRFVARVVFEHHIFDDTLPSKAVPETLLAHCDTH